MALMLELLLKEEAINYEQKDQYMDEMKVRLKTRMKGLFSKKSLEDNNLMSRSAIKRYR